MEDDVKRLSDRVQPKSREKRGGASNTYFAILNLCKIASNILGCITETFFVEGTRKKGF